MSDDVARCADILLEAAREYYGQGFKTDREYWLFLARKVREHDASISKGTPNDRG